MKLSGAQIVIETLKAEGIHHIFGVSGSPVLPYLDLIYQEPQFRYIQAQHEQNAMYMANGYARAKGAIGVCLVSPGPGITNCLSAVSQAYYSSTPSLLIAAEETVRFHGRGSSLHHDLEAVPMLRMVTKHALRVERADRIAESLRSAFRVALSGRRGPVYVGIAKDISREEADFDALSPRHYRVESAYGPDRRFIADAADLLAAGQRPAALVGGGLAWSRAQDVLLELAELLAMPVAATRENKGLIPEDHSLALGSASDSGSPLAKTILQQADVLLAIGCTFDEFTTMRFGYSVIPQGAKIIQVDIDPAEIGKNYPIDVGILGDARTVLIELLGEIRGRNIDRRPVEGQPRIRELLRVKGEWRESLLPGATSKAVPIQRLRLLSDLRRALPRDAVVAGCSGGTDKWFNYAFEALAHNLAIGSWHPLGSEYPESLGVKVALPDRVVVCLTGDGSMMMTLQEIATAVAHEIPMLCVVCHNDSFGNMRYTQLKKFGGRFIGTDLPIPDLAAIAREFGAHGERIDQPDEIIPAIGRAIESGKPALLEVMMDRSLDNLVPPPSTVDFKKDW